MKSFLKTEDRHELFEHIKKVNMSCNMINPEVQGLLDAIEKKCITINKMIYDGIVTIAFIGVPGNGKSTMMGIMRTINFPGFRIVEVNEENHYLRYVKEKDESEYSDEVFCDCGGPLKLLKNNFAMCKSCGQQFGIGSHSA